MANPADRGRGFPESGATERAQETTGTMKERAQEMASGAAARAQEMASGVAERAGEAWGTSSERARQMASSAAHSAEEAWDSINTFVRRHPMATLCIGLGIGFLVATAFAGYSYYEPRAGRTRRYYPGDVGP